MVGDGGGGLSKNKNDQNALKQSTKKRDLGQYINDSKYHI